MDALLQFITFHLNRAMPDSWDMQGELRITVRPKNIDAIGQPRLFAAERLMMTRVYDSRHSLIGADGGLIGPAA